ncbi:MAG: polymer-forming cytoskeletal protein, partial [SAR324 cluster bacterium]|nr:polymer-forming cytoskeletal protein [SAR324 cluster bacterium]
MAFWTKKTDVSSTNTSSTQKKQSQDFFYSGVKQESKGLFDRKTETLIDGNSALERFGQVRSALGTGTVIQGKLTFDTPVRIDGKLSGEIFSTAALIVGREGVIDASVDVTTLIVLGAIKGPIRASERAEVYSGGSLE